MRFLVSLLHIDIKVGYKKIQPIKAIDDLNFKILFKYIYRLNEDIINKRIAKKLFTKNQTALFEGKLN